MSKWRRVSCLDPPPVLLNKTRGLRYLGEVPKGWVPVVFLLYCVSIVLGIKWGRVPNSERIPWVLVILFSIFWVWWFSSKVRDFNSGLSRKAGSLIREYPPVSSNMAGWKIPYEWRFYGENHWLMVHCHVRYRRVPPKLLRWRRQSTTWGAMMFSKPRLVYYGIQGQPQDLNIEHTWITGHHGWLERPSPSKIYWLTWSTGTFPNPTSNGWWPGNGQSPFKDCDIVFPGPRHNTCPLYKHI